MHKKKSQNGVSITELTVLLYVVRRRKVRRLQMPSKQSCYGMIAPLKEKNTFINGGIISCKNLI